MSDDLSGSRGNKGSNKSCDKITPTEMQDVLKKINAENAEIFYIKKSPLAGICEVAINRGGQPDIFYIDITKTYLIYGNLVELKTMTNLRFQSAKAIQIKSELIFPKSL